VPGYTRHVPGDHPLQTQHGFCFPERQVYAAAASEEVWTVLFDLWDRNLKPKR
jgi:hypothetical protein